MPGEVAILCGSQLISTHLVRHLDVVDEHIIDEGKDEGEEEGLYLARGDSRDRRDGTRMQARSSAHCVGGLAHQAVDCGDEGEGGGAECQLN